MARSNPIRNVLKGQNFRPFKVLVIDDADYLGKEAQHSLRRTMEKYSPVCRLIMCCENTSKIISPLRSRCLSMRVPAPNYKEIYYIMCKMCENEKLYISKL